MESNKKLTLEDIGSFLSKLAEKSDSVYWLSSPDFKKIQYISPAYEEIWGRDRATLYAEPELWITYLHPDDIKGYHPIHEMGDKIKNEGSTARYHEHYRILRPNGEIRWIIDQGFPIYDMDGQCCGVTGVAVDITQEKQAEEELRREKEKVEAANRTKTEFLENMRHDIRTPLSGIVGFAQLIQNKVTDPKVKEYASNLMASGQALNDLLNEVLEAIHVSSGEIPVVKKKFNLQQKLNEIITLNKSKALHKNVDLSMEHDSSIPKYVMGDPARIYRIVLEMVTNALNFTHKGYVKLSAQLARDNEDDVIVKIIVDDTGIGIPIERQQDIYLQFKRLTPSYEGIYKGHGLGLSIVKQLVDDLKGEIHLESQMGQGSKFTLIFKFQKSLLDEEFGSDSNTSLSPTATPFTPAIEFESGQIPKELSQSYRSRILVVEDSDLAAKAVTNMLSEMECEVDLAKKGKEAIDFVERNQYDLIFMDIGLPDIDGYEVTKRIRLHELNKAHVPIIALTAHVSEENKKHCIDIGMNAVLTKPLFQEKAEDILNSFIPYRKDKLNAKNDADIVEEIIESDELPIFDFEQLKNNFGGMKNAIEMATRLCEELPDDIKEIQAAYHEKDWSLVQSLTHKLKGGASYCAVPRLERACEELENAVRNDKDQNLEDLYNQLLNEIRITEKTIKETI